MAVRQVNAPRIRKSRRRTGYVRAARRALLPIILPIGLVAAVWHWGSPHILFDYTYRPMGRIALYERCRYLGIEGWVVLRGNPIGNCPYVTLIRHENWPFADWRR